MSFDDLLYDLADAIRARHVPYHLAIAWQLRGQQSWDESTDDRILRKIIVTLDAANASCLERIGSCTPAWMPAACRRCADAVRAAVPTAPPIEAVLAAVRP